MAHQMQYESLGQAAYEALRFQILANVEESGSVSLTPYADGKGFITIRHRIQPERHRHQDESACCVGCSPE